ncbi:hypothetical protein PBAC_31780 [Pedobacter glucosidilyticus]|nr:hypothetical protein PBAC_31780 [Pedobacter glucosidilyticus]
MIKGGKTTVFLMRLQFLLHILEDTGDSLLIMRII